MPWVRNRWTEVRKTGPWWNRWTEVIEHDHRHYEPDPQPQSYQQAVYRQPQKYYGSPRQQTADELRKERIKQIEHQVAVTRREARLVRAQAGLQAQRDLAYQIAQKRLLGELLDELMYAAEKRAVIERSSKPQPKQIAYQPQEPWYDDALHEARAMLRANGLEAPLLDKAIERRNGRG